MESFSIKSLYKLISLLKAKLNWNCSAEDKVIFLFFCSVTLSVLMYFLSKSLISSIVDANKFK